MAYTERTHEMMKNFMSLHEQGFTIQEIAELFMLNSKTVYRHLQEIADANGTTREALLKIARVSGTRKDFNERTQREKTTFEAVEHGFKVLEQDLEAMIKTLEEELKDDIII